MTDTQLFLVSLDKLVERAKREAVEKQNKGKDNFVEYNED